jgi:hypothetical protein
VSILSSGIDVMLVWQALMAKIKDRARRKAALTDRKSAAAQARMKNMPKRIKRRCAWLRSLMGVRRQWCVGMGGRD